MREPGSVPLNRRRVLGLGAAIAAAVGFDRARSASAHNLPSGEFGGAAYDRMAAVDTGYKAVFQSPNIEASVRTGNTLNHLLLIQLKNWLNGFQFSYKVRPEDLHTVVATYASANLLTYSDAVWAKYKLGDKYNVVDPTTNAPAVKNVFWASRFGEAASTEPDNPQSVYQDTGIQALQRRGALFLT